MKIVLSIVFYSLSLQLLLAQNNDTIIGSVSFINTSSTYLKFNNTKKLNIGDSLYKIENNTFIACLVIQQLSSLSAACTSIAYCKTVIGDKLYFIKSYKNVVQDNFAEKKSDTITKKNIDTLFNPSSAIATNTSKRSKENLNIRLLSSATGSFNNSINEGTHRARASMTFNYDNINNSKWSIHSFINYNYRLGKVFNPNILRSDLKIYGLDVEYRFDSTQVIIAGRRINNNISSVGAIDGLQYEKRIKKFIFGAAIGSRPDLTRYNYNLQLPLYGLYSVYNGRNNAYQHTAGVFEIRNHGKTDRRFAYFQHNNSNLIKNLFLFSSAEFDLYQLKDSVFKNSFSLTSFFVNARYKVNRKLSLSASYDNRKNVIFFESFKNQLDQLLDEETRTGIRLQVSYQLFRYLNLNANYFYRYQGKQSNPTRNVTAYLGSNRIPGVLMTTSLSYNYIETIYFNGQTISLRANKDFFKGKSNVELDYRKINYKYLSTELELPKNIFVLSISQILSRSSTLLISGEWDIEPQQQAQRYFVTFIRRIRKK
ncbi:MAG: hypothetical protein IT267_12485 [Saprospiraceae bacterium]|nr:hypothetical protein [Saprospiraceae bacterium]